MNELDRDLDPGMSLQSLTAMGEELHPGEQ